MTTEELRCGINQIKSLTEDEIEDMLIAFRNTETEKDYLRFVEIIRAIRE